MKNIIEKWIIRILVILFCVIISLCVFAGVCIIIDETCMTSFGELYGDSALFVMICTCMVTAVDVLLLIFINIGEIWNSLK